MGKFESLNLEKKNNRGLNLLSAGLVVDRKFGFSYLTPGSDKENAVEELHFKKVKELANKMAKGTALTDEEKRAFEESKEKTKIYNEERLNTILLARYEIGNERIKQIIATGGEITDFDRAYLAEREQFLASLQQKNIQSASTKK